VHGDGNGYLILGYLILGRRLGLLEDFTAKTQKLKRGAGEEVKSKK
jgi:hypothetical protein